jgi:cytochrome c-type biogenesis protein CcmE
VIDEPKSDPSPSDGDNGMAVPVRRRRNSPTPGDSKKNLVLVIGLVMAVVGIVAVVFIFMKDTSVYAKPVDELMQQKAQFLASSAHPARPVRVEGLLVHGTLEKRDKPCEYRFHIEKHGTDLPVRYGQCVVPDTFRDVAGMEVGVTVEGELQPDGSFEASSVLAKCPSKYEMQQRAAKGESMPTGDHSY